MDKEGKFWIRVVGCLCIAAVAIAIVIAVYNYKLDIEAMERGYQKVTIPYTYKDVYQKVD